MLACDGTVTLTIGINPVVLVFLAASWMAAVTSILSVTYHVCRWYVKQMSSVGLLFFESLMITTHTTQQTQHDTRRHNTTVNTTLNSCTVDQVEVAVVPYKKSELEKMDSYTVRYHLEQVRQAVQNVSHRIPIPAFLAPCHQLAPSNLCKKISRFL